jgi:hypothetical protein
MDELVHCKKEEKNQCLSKKKFTQTEAMDELVKVAQEADLGMYLFIYLMVCIYLIYLLVQSRSPMSVLHRRRIWVCIYLFTYWFLFLFFYFLVAAPCLFCHAHVHTRTRTPTQARTHHTGRQAGRERESE